MLELIRAGMDVARLHFSYGEHEEHAENIRRLRQAAAMAGREVAILQDLCGTKVRMKEFGQRRVELKAGGTFKLTSRNVIGDAKRVAINIPELLSVIESGDTILLADGALKLEAVGVSPREVRCKVVVGGRIKSGQAVHVPGKSPPVRVPTAKDRDDVRFGIRHGVDWIAQSFATTAVEVNDLRRFIRRHGADIPVMVKIERQEALANLDALIRAADGVMVARGDLGLSIPLEEMAFAQKQIIWAANLADKPVITATEMLFSMMKQPSPTRAEVTDIANAVLDGSDAVMLSGETAVGKHPVAATLMMAKVAAAACRHLNAGASDGKAASGSNAVEEHIERPCSVEPGSRKNNALAFSKIVRTNEARKQS